MISVIVPVYGVEAYLRKCIDSILNQTCRDLEVILVDDGSPDDCGVICDEYASIDSRVRVFHTENHGLSAARNLGLLEARGDTISFIDSDDWIESNMLEVMKIKMEETGATVCICGFWIENGFSQDENLFQNEIFTGNTALRALIEGRINDNVWNKLYRREVFVEQFADDSSMVGAADNLILFPNGKNYEDYYIMHKIIKSAKKVIVLNQSLYHYRMRKDSITQDYSAKNLLDFAEAHFERYFFLRNDKEAGKQFSEAEIMAEPAKGVSKVWRWWQGCSHEEKEENREKLKEMEVFMKNNCPLFGYHSWPAYLRVSSFFMHSKSRASLLSVYYLNRAYRRMSASGANKMHCRNARK